MIKRLLVAATLSLARIDSSFAIAGVESPPAPSAPHEVSFPTPKETRLDNGLRVMVAERPGLPLIAAQLVVRSGAEADPNDRAGLASMTASLLTQGTEKMSAPEIARAIESLGGSLESDAHWDASKATVIVIADKAAEALAILADVVLHPTFKQEEIDRLRNQTLDGLRVSLQQPGSLARFVTARVLFGTGEYGHAVSGTPETVQAIQREDIVKLYRQCYRPDNAALVLSGDITLAAARNFAQKLFGEWKGESSAANEKHTEAAVADGQAHEVVIDMPQAGQAAVTVGKPGIARTSPDYYTAMIANAALGTGFISRLNREIRIKRGLSYGAGSAMDARRDVGPFVASAQTKNQSAAEVATLLEGELKRLASEPVAGEELKSRQAVLTGSYARGLETNEGFVAQTAALATYDLPLDTLDKFIPSINAVTTESITAFATKYFDTPPSLIIVGKASEFIEPLRKDFPQVQVIPQAKLDLNKAELSKAN